MKSDKKSKIFGIFLVLINFITAIILIISLIKINMFPNKYLIAMIIIILLFPCIIFYTLQSERFSNVGKIISLLVSIIFICITVPLLKIHNMFLEISDSDIKIDNLSVIVLKEDIAEDIKDATDYSFGIQKELYRDGTDKTIQNIEDEYGCKLKTVLFDDLSSQVKSLYDEKVGAIIINEAFRDIIIEIIPDFNHKTKILGYRQIETKIDTATTTEEINKNDSAKDNNDAITEANNESMNEKENFQKSDKAFTVYISGIDTFGTVSHTSRSDLNIIAVVNTAVKKIQLINTPRDYYVRIPVSGGQMDKLTHAGIYGVDVSIKTLEKLYQIKIDYYVRVNITSLKDVVDALGGIDAEVDYAFDTYNKKYSFTEGMNHLDGNAAIAFARERYAFKDGDRQRGRNQMTVIKAILNKATTPAIFAGIDDIINSLSKSFQTDMPSAEISDLIKMQIDEVASWDVKMYSVDGKGEYRTTYSGGKQNLYVMIPNLSTVNAARENMTDVMNDEWWSINNEWNFQFSNIVNNAVINYI